MGINGINDLYVILGEVKKSSQKWSKHSSTLHLLADQIMGLERFEKEKMNIEEDTYTAVRCTIQSKIADELEKLTSVLNDLEGHFKTLPSIIKKLESDIQIVVENEQSNSGRSMPELPLLQTTYSIYNHLSILISMRRIPLHNADTENFKALHDFRKINLTSHPIETELEKTLHEIELLQQTSL